MKPGYESLREHADVRKPQELTERGEYLQKSVSLWTTDVVEYAAWTKIQPRIVQHMELIRRLRFSLERHDVLTKRCSLFVELYREWFSQQQSKETLSPPGEMLRRPEVVSIVVQPSEVEVGKEAFERFREHFPDWTQKWREDCEVQLRAIMLSSSEYKDKVPANGDPLSLASVMFDCMACQRYTATNALLPPLPPHTIAHDCLTGPCSMWNGKDPVERALYAAIPHPHGAANVGSMSWSAKSLRIGVWHRRACEVIRAAGKDPMTTTREEMDALEVRFWCKPCLEDCFEEKRQVMKWRDAVRIYRADSSLDFAECACSSITMFTMTL